MMFIWEIIKFIVEIICGVNNLYGINYLYYSEIIDIFVFLQVRLDNVGYDVDIYGLGGDRYEVKFFDVFFYF